MSSGLDVCLFRGIGTTSDLLKTFWTFWTLGGFLVRVWHYSETSIFHIHQFTRCHKIQWMKLYQFQTTELIAKNFKINKLWATTWHGLLWKFTPFLFLRFACMTFFLKKFQKYSPKWWFDGDLPWYKVYKKSLKSMFPSHFDTAAHPIIWPRPPWTSTSACHLCHRWTSLARDPRAQGEGHAGLDKRPNDFPTVQLSN